MRIFSKFDTQYQLTDILFQKIKFTKSNDMFPRVWQGSIKFLTDLISLRSIENG